VNVMVKSGSVALLALAVSTVAAPVDWPQFRGPDGQGRSTSRGLPLTWSEGTNVRWKVPIHGRAWSSPVVMDDRVWLTTATEEGRELFLVALDRDTGKVVLDRKLFDVDKPQYVHPFNTYASPTPVLERGRIYVTFGSAGTAAVDTRTGAMLWARRDLECNHFRGAGSSPIVFGDLLVLHFDGSDRQYLGALDKKTGRTVWRTERSIDFQDLGADGKPEAEGDFRKAFSTPHVATLAGRDMLVSIGSKATYAYDPRTGRELWRVEERGSHSGSTRPVVGHGLVFVPTGFPTGEVLAVRPDGRGDVTQSHVAWRLARGAPKKPSLLLVGDLLFMIADNGIASCAEARTGAVVWTRRVGGAFTASPLWADGRVYLFSEEGKTTVIEAGREYRVLAENELADGILASPAVAGDALFVRTRRNLYRIEKAPR
jgi:outer membrane protein assembly factor BamB